jgi:tRNA nucleotidyltransferase/poly(A) polymerase
MKLNSIKNKKFTDYFYKNVSSKYDIKVIHEINNSCLGKLFVFGGAIRSYYLGENFKDIDYKLVVKKGSFIDSIKCVESILDKKNISYSKWIIEKNVANISFQVQSYESKLNKIDIEIIFVTYDKNPLDTFLNHFSINSLNWDINNNNLYYIGDGLKDLENRVVKLNQRADIDSSNFLFFRSIYLSIKSGFEIDKDTLKILLKDRKRIERALMFFLKSDNKTQGLFYFNQIFGARKIDPELYDQLMTKYSVFSYLEFLVENYPKLIRRKLKELSINENDYFFGSLSIK